MRRDVAVKVRPAGRRLLALTPGARKYLLFVILVAPAFLLRLSTAAYPIGQTIVLSTTNLSILKGTNSFVGLQNYRDMFSDFGVRGALGFTIMYVVYTALLDIIVGMLVALLLNTAFRGRTIVRTLTLIPWAVPTIVAGYTFRWLLDDQFGLIPQWITQLTGFRPVVFTSPTAARIVVILVQVWKDAPFIAIVLLAGLQGMPQDLYEAARVDGANPWQRFWRITVPLLLPLRIFQEGILFFKFGFASAISVVLLLLVALIGVAGLWLFRKTDVSY